MQLQYTLITAMAHSGGAQRWRTAVARRGGAQRWRTAVAHRGGAQRWRAEVAHRGGAQRRRAAMAHSGGAHSEAASQRRRHSVDVRAAASQCAIARQSRSGGNSGTWLDTTVKHVLAIIIFLMNSAVR